MFCQKSIVAKIAEKGLLNRLVFGSLVGATNLPVSVIQLPSKRRSSCPTEWRREATRRFGACRQSGLLYDRKADNAPMDLSRLRQRLGVCQVIDYLCHFVGSATTDTFSSLSMARRKKLSRPEAQPAGGPKEARLIGVLVENK